MKEYIIQNGGHTVLNEYTKHECFSEKTRRVLINHLTNFITERFGSYPNKDQKVMVAKATIELFPALKVKDSEIGGIVCIYTFFTKLHNCFYFYFFNTLLFPSIQDLLYDPTANKGWLISKLKYHRLQTKKATQGNKEPESGSDDEQQAVYNDYEAKADVTFLKSVVVNACNMDLIKTKLRATMEYRNKLLDDMELNFIETFPYFFVHPDLVCYFFAITTFH